MFENVKYVFLIGIGGIGMSALARYFNFLGKQVYGYDKTQTALTEQLEKEGIQICFDEDVEHIPAEIKTDHQKYSLIIYTPAIPATHKQLAYFIKHEFMPVKRSVVLGQISKQYKSIAVAGTHGKTTTSSLIAHIYKCANIPVIAFLGGITQNYESNLLLDNNAETMIVEADEFDKSFLTLHPQLAIITSLDPDHLDIYNTAEQMQLVYNQFAAQVTQTRILKKEISTHFKTISHTTYSINTAADFMGKNVRVENGLYYFDLHYSGKCFPDIPVGLPGKHNVENALAAAAAAITDGVPIESVLLGISTFKGVKRRFEYLVREPHLVVIDDYAHHPEELKACILSAKELYPSKKITGVFQPHLFSRTNDFADAFASSLDLLDEAILLDIYPARELPMPGVTSQMLLEKMKTTKKKVISKQALAETLSETAVEVLLFLGAGDIDQLCAPLARQLLQKKKT